MTLRIIIADDHPVVRIGAKAVIENSGVGRVVAEASSTEELFAVLRTHECDVLVTDYSMPNTSMPDGIGMIEKVRRQYPELPMLLLSVSSNLAILRMVAATGVLGLVDKDSPMEELPVAIKAVYGRKAYVSRTLKNRIDKRGTQHIGDDRTRDLSPREVEVLRLLGTGLIVKEIAHKLHKSVSTISRQKGDAMLKLGIEKDVDLYDYLRDHPL